MLRFPFLATGELSTGLYDVLNCAVPFGVGGWGQFHDEAVGFSRCVRARDA